METAGLFLVACLLIAVLSFYWVLLLLLVRRREARVADEIGLSALGLLRFMGSWVGWKFLWSRSVHLDDPFCAALRIVCRVLYTTTVLWMAWVIWSAGTAG